MTLLILAVVFGFVITLCLLLGSVREYRFAYVESAPEALKARRERALATSALRRAIDPFVLSGAALVSKLGLESHRARVRQRLLQSGNPWGYSAEEFVGFAGTLAAATYLGVLFLLFVATQHTRVFTSLAPALLAYWLVMKGLEGDAMNRRRRIDRDMPFFLDLVSMSLQAGATFGQACRRLVDSGTGGPMQEELATMLREMDAGVNLADGLSGMEKRTGSDEVGFMAQAARQGQELGTPLAQIFVDQSITSRYRRTKRAEQAAAKLPNRLAVPTVFLMVAVLLLLFGPMIARFARDGFMGS